MLLSKRMSVGEVFEFRGLGYFSLKNCKLRSETAIEPEPTEKEKPVKMILFSQEAEFKEESENIHFFSIPEVNTEKEDDTESHLSLSIEKPLITESEFAEEIFSAFKSNSEIQENFKSKAEILINTMQRTGTEMVEVFTIDTLPEESVEDESTEQKRISQDEVFEQDEQSERVSVDDIKDSSSSLPWDFGRKFFDRRIDYPERERLDAQSSRYQSEEQKPGEDSKSLSEQRIVEETKKEEPDKEHIKTFDEKNKDGTDTEKHLDSDEEESVNVEKINRYERVRTFISSEMKSREQPDDKESEEVEKELLKLDEVKETEDDFTPVKSKSETYRLEPRKKKKPFFTKKDSISLSEAKAKYNYHRRKRGILPYAVPLAILIILFGIVYIFLAEDSILSSEPENVILEVKPPPHVNIIERDFEFAVTFPYSKSDANNEISGIDPSVFEEDIKLVEQKPEIKVNEQEKKVQLEDKTDEIVKERETPRVEPRQTIMNKNISKYKDYYIVQVAAYKTYEAADAEAEKFRNQGYNAFIEIAELPGRGTWYRIKVGDFTSVKHAEDFLNKNRN